MSVSNRTRTVLLVSAALAASVGAVAYSERAAGQSAAALLADTVEMHTATAKRIAGNDRNVQAALRLCTPPQTDGAAKQAKAPEPAQANTAEPAKIFDNLYFVGVPSVSAWAVTTSDGIIVIDSLNNPREAETFIEGGLRKLGLDPMQVKYVIITHGHADHYGGAQYLADKLKAQLVMSETDWNFLSTARPSTNPERGPIPRRGMSLKDGEKLTLGDTSIEAVETPPHTPGAISLIIPLKEGNTTHVGALWGGIGFNFQRTEQNFTTYSNSVGKFAEIARARNVDVQMANHSNFDNAFPKMAALKARSAGQPHPFVVGGEVQQRIFDVQQDCALAQRAMLRTASTKK
jgi:metallo-beta-lactamase class B